MADFFHPEYVQKESQPFDTNLKCFLCLENIFKCDTLNLNSEVGANQNTASLEASSNIKIEGGYYSPPQKIPLRSICRYLSIDFQQVFTGYGDKLSSDEMCADGTFCNQCFSIVSPLSALCNQLELLQMKLSYYLKSVVEVAERLSAGKATNNSIEERNQKVSQLLRLQISEKGKVKLNQAIPKVKLVRVSSVPLSNHFLNAMPSTEKKTNTDEMTNMSSLACDDTKNVIKCEICGKGFTTRRNLIMHKQAIHEGFNKNFICDSCGKVFPCRSGLRNHVETVHNKEKALKNFHMCSVCGKCYKYATDFYQHRKLGHDEKGNPNVLKCDICEKVYNSIRSMMAHKKVHEGSKDNLKCETCGKVFTKRTNLTRHKQVVHEGGKDNFKCDSCSRVFRWKSNLQNHVKVVHNKEEALNRGILNINKHHPCNVCGKVLTSKDILTIHKKVTHEGVRNNYKCDICGKFFSWRGSLRIHVKRVHNREGTLKKPYVCKCNVCGKVVSSKDALIEHKKVIHEGFRNNFKCDVCGKVFTWRSDFWKHVKVVHNREGTLKKSYVCNVCGKLFKDASLFYKHKRLGHDEQGKPNLIQCEICGKVFTSISGMISHKKAIHEGVGGKHKCDSCGKVFHRPSFLERHKATKHRRHLSNGRVSKGVDIDKANLNSEESEPVVKVCILPKFTEQQDIEHAVEGSKEGMHLGGSADYDEMKEEEDHFYTEYVSPSVISSSNDHFDCHSEEIQVEMKIVPD